MNIKIFALIGLISFVAVPTYADDDFDDVEYEEEFDEGEASGEDVIQRNIATRMTCDEIKAKITELQEGLEEDPDLATELDDMLARQRSQCSSRARKRPVRDYNNVAPITTTVEADIIEDEAPEEVVEPIQEVKPTPEELAKEKAALAKQAQENMARGLCPDGAKPNKYGCCAGEKFKEVSSMTFACCPKTGDGDCHEPLKKK